MTTETELLHLLEMAARACGYMPNNNWQWCQRAGTDGAFRYRLGGDWVEWAPHTDDGDSARMRSALLVDVYMQEWQVVCTKDRRAMFFEKFADHNNDRNAALRLCALKVAAMIGVGME